VGETLRFAHRYVTYFGILLILIFILVHKGKEIQERFKVPNPSLIARLYNGIIQFLFWCLLAFLLVVLALFLGNEIIEATELLSSFLQTIVLLFLSISLVRFFDRFRPMGKAEQSPFSLALDRKFLRTVGMTYLVNALQFSIALAMLFLSLSIWGIESRQIVSLITSDTVRNVFWRLVKTVMILFGSVFFVRWTTRFIDLLFFSPDISWSAFSLRRRTTFGPLLKSVIRYITYTVAGFLALSTLGVNPKGLLAGISVVGIAIGFGAQTLVRDIITGFFLVLEDSIAVGDVVEAVGITGTVEEIGIRVTHIREFNGKLHVIPNGEISRLGNFNREWMRAIVEVSVAYEADIDKAFLALQEIGEAFCATHPDIVLDPPKVQGPIALGPSEVILRLVIKVKAMEHWEAERQLRRRIKQVFDQRGIEIPFPRRVIYHKYPPTQEHPAPPPHREEGIDYGSPTPGSSSRNA
ncbi:MAG: mechanosensitive ion channel family protein, partial [Deltaproteobacteria bacterium]